ncbi:MAG: hypothetical protein ACHQM6_02665 [Candidatus Kapaibacterium sp.]
MTKKSVVRKITYSLLGVLIVLVLACWLFFTFYFQNFVNAHLNTKLKEATLTSTHGLFRLEVGKVQYANGSLYCTRVELIRTRYDSSESGLTVKYLIADSVHFQGLHLLDLLRGKGLFLERLSAASPQIFIGDAATGREELRKSKQDTTPFSSTMPKGMPVISYDKINLPNISLHIPVGFTPRGVDTLYRGIGINLRDLRIDDSVLRKQPVLFCKGVDLTMKNFPFGVTDSNYSLNIVGIHASFEDSIITVDSFSFKPKYSEEVFASKYRYATPRLSFHCFGIRLDGINFGNSLSQGTVTVRKFVVSSFDLDSYEDHLRPKNPHPNPVMFPNEMIGAFPGRLTIDSFIIDKGRIRLRERWKGGTGVLGFDKVRISASPIINDSANKMTEKRAKITIDALFIGEAPLKAELYYFLSHKTFDMDARATLGSFSALKLNPWLIPVERMKVKSGVFHKGTIDMTIRAGKAITKVVPLYRDFLVNILPADPHQKSGFAEKIKTFAVSTFVIRSNNPNGLGSTKIGLTEYPRIGTEQFFQYLWLAIRKSLEKVVG